MNISNTHDTAPDQGDHNALVDAPSVYDLNDAIDGTDWRRERASYNADADEPLWSCPACGAPQYEARAFCADCERPCADDSPMEVTR